MIDNTYTPLRNDLNDLVARIFPTGLLADQMDTLTMFFFAGAAAAAGPVKSNPDFLETIVDELSDASGVWGATTTKVQ